VKEGDLAAAREVCQKALAAAGLKKASSEWLAAADGALWPLGYAAYQHMKKHSEEKVSLEVILFDFDGNILAKKS